MKRLHLAVLILACLGGVASAIIAAPPVLAERTASARSPRPVLPFLHDDYTRAVAEARARRVPLFIEAWAPW